MVDVLRRMSTPWHLWLVGVLSFLWNALFVWQWTLQVTGDPAYWSSLTPAEAAYLRAVPIWTDVAVGVAFWGGLLAAVLLLFRRRHERWARDHGAGRRGVRPGHHRRPGRSDRLLRLDGPTRRDRLRGRRKPLLHRSISA